MIIFNIYAVVYTKIIIIIKKKIGIQNSMG